MSTTIEELKDEYLNNLRERLIVCKHCYHIWVPIKDKPKRCARCTNPLREPKYMKAAEKRRKKNRGGL